MRILIDTHLLLWWLGDMRALSQTARQLIREPENTIFISAVSLWEVWLKASLGKLELPENFDAILSKEPFESLPMSAAHARQVGKLPWHHRDPFDRMLVAQAQIENLVLLTADGRMCTYGDVVRLAD